MKYSMPALISTGVIALALYGLLHTSSFFENVYLDYITIGIMFVLLGFSYGFNKLKAFFLGIHILVVWIIFQPFSMLDSFHEMVWLSILLPLNIAAILVVNNGAVLSIQGKSLAVLIVAQLVLLYFVDLAQIPSVPSWLNKVLTTPGEGIPVESLVLYIVIIFAAVISNIVRYSTEKTFLTGAILSLGLSLYFWGPDQEMELLLAGSGVLLFLSVVYGTYSMAYMDELTQIPSRRKLRVDLMKLGSKYGIAMLDIDYFKKFNDRYGHDTGDEVLRLVARCLEKVTGGGKAYRYGGEEFTILFPGKDVKSMLPHLEDIRKQVSRQTYTYKKKSRNGKMRVQQLKVTISIGAAEKKADLKTADDVIKAADKALYRAKKKGRNCVSI